MSHVNHESCHTCNTCMSHVIHVTHESRMLSCTFVEREGDTHTHTRQSHTHTHTHGRVTHTHTHTHGRVDGMLGMSHAIYMNESCDMYMSHATHVWHDSCVATYGKHDVQQHTATHCNILQHMGSMMYSTQSQHFTAEALIALKRGLVTSHVRVTSHV